jgi:hypothetical protein
MNKTSIKNIIIAILSLILVVIAFLHFYNNITELNYNQGIAEGEMRATNYFISNGICPVLNETSLLFITYEDIVNTYISQYQRELREK